MKFVLEESWIILLERKEMYEKIRHKQWDNHLLQYVETNRKNLLSYDMCKDSQKERIQSRNKEHILISVNNSYPTTRLGIIY
jgi:hypothetical protein